MDLTSLQYAGILLACLVVGAIVARLVYPHRKKHLNAARDKGCECRAGKLIVWAHPDCPVHGEKEEPAPLAEDAPKDKDPADSTSKPA